MYFPNDGTIGRHHGRNRFFFDKVVVSCMKKHYISRELMIQAVNALVQKLYRMSAKSAMVERAYATFALPGTNEVKFISGAE